MAGKPEAIRVRMPILRSRDCLSRLACLADYPDMFLQSRLFNQERTAQNPFEVLTRPTVPHSLAPRSHVMKPDQINILASAMFRRLEQVQNAKESRLARQFKIMPALTEPLNADAAPCSQTLSGAPRQLMVSYYRCPLPEMVRFPPSWANLI
jgi:hypothetical protein